MATTPSRSAPAPAAPAPAGECGGAPPRALVVMGVAGCGKSSLGAACARELGWSFIEADAHHAGASIEKMRRGAPLDEADRRDWLERLAGLLAAQSGGPQPGCVLSCSALRLRHRERLRAAVPGLRFAFLDLDRATAHARVAARRGHDFPASLVDSQFATLERPDGEPGVLRLDANAPQPALLHAVLEWLRPPTP